VAESLLALRDILVRYGDKTALKIPRLEIKSGEALALLGPNGAGKTTLLKVMGLLQLPAAGEVYFDGAKARASNALAIRRRIAMVFQEPSAAERVGISKRGPRPKASRICRS
jgi:tungstate transport system ATP-binding protein